MKNINVAYRSDLAHEGPSKNARTPSLARNLQLLIAINGSKQKDLATKAGVPPSTLNKILHGKVDDPQMSTLVAISNFFKVTVGQLIGLESLGPDQEEETQVNIPVLKWNEVQYWLAQDKNPNAVALTERVPAGISIAKSGFALRTAKNLGGHFQKNSLLIFDTSEIRKSNGYILVSENGSVPLLKAFTKQENHLYVRSLRPKSTPVHLSPSTSILGKLIELRYPL